MNVGVIQNHLPLKVEPEEPFNILRDVPYAQSEHYDSSQTFDDKAEEMENFTDEEEQEGEESIPLENHKRKVVINLD